MKGFLDRGSIPLSSTLKPLILLGFQALGNQKVIKKVIKVIRRMFDWLQDRTEFWNRAQNLGFPCITFSITMIMIFCADYIGVEFSFSFQSLKKNLHILILYQSTKLLVCKNPRFHRNGLILTNYCVGHRPFILTQFANFL